MRMTLVFLLAAVSTFPALAQQAPAAKKAGQSKIAAAPSLPPDAPSKEQLIRLFDVMEVQKQMASTMTAVGNNMEKVMASNMDTLSVKQKAAMAKLQSDLFARMMAPEFVDGYLAELIPIYQRHFTKAEVDDLISFYASPVGQKFLHEQPLITQESFSKILPMMQKRIQEVMGEIKFEERMKEIFEENEAPAKPGKQ